MPDTYTEPVEFRAGETIAWLKEDFADYPHSSGWTAKYTITGNGGSATITGLFADGKWTFTLTAAANVLAAGDYMLYGYVTKGSGASEESFPIYPPTYLNVTRNYKTASTTDVRTFAEQSLAAIETFITRVSANPTHEQEIAGRRFSRLNLLEAMKFRNQLLSEIEREEQKERQANGETTGEILHTFESELQ